MKRFMKSVALVAMVAMGLTACQNDIDEQIEVKDSVVVTFVADSAESRTSVDTSGDDKPVFSWDEVETFKVLEQTDKLAGATNVVFEKDEESGTATITATFDNNSGKGAYKYVTVYPESGYVEAESIESATLSVSANQTMYSAGTYDPNADLMVSMVVEATEQPTEVQPVRFTRLVAVAEMTLKNLELEDGDVIKSVTFTAEGKTIAGTITSDLTAPYEGFEAKAGVSSVSVDIPEEGFDSKVYFTLLPTTLAAGEKYTVAVVTENYIYAKTGEIPEGKSLAFEAGNVTRFGANMQDVAKGDKWVLVRDASELNSGDVVTFATKNSNRVMGCTYSGSYPYASYTEIIKVGDYLYHPIEVNANNQRIQHLVLASRGEGFDIYNGVDYDGDGKTGYLYASNSSQTSYTSGYLKLQAYPDNNTLFYISIADNGVATIQANDSEYTNNCVRYYNKSTYHYFQLWNEITDETAVCIYKLEGAEPVEIPVAGANFSVPTKDVVLEKDAVVETVLADAKFNYLGEWTIDVTAKVKDSEEVAEWLTVAYDAVNNRLTYAAEANEGTVRYATVTVTATLAGEEDIKKSFDVVQKGAPQEISIAEFIEKGQDVNATYKLTGKLVTIPASASSAFVLEDAEGKKAQIKYLKIEGGDYVVDQEAVVLKVGDVVTVTTVVTSDTKGMGGSSTYPSIYVGHYNISATATPDLVSYEEGSEATITIAKGGNLEPGTITGSLIDAEGVATLTHNAGETTATITFAENSGAPREVTATFTDGWVTTEVTVAQTADDTKGLTWKLVTDASTLKEGDKVMIAAKNASVALGTPNDSDSRQAVAVTMIADGQYLVPAFVGAETFILKKGTDNTFAFYDANEKGFLVSTSKSNTSYYLRTQAYPNVDTYFTVGETISNPAGDYKDNVLCYHDTKNLFYSGSNKKEVAYLYKLVGGAGTIPTIDAVVELPAADTRLSIVAEATTEKTLIEDVEFIYTDGWEISVSADKDWLTVSYENGNLYYTAEANDSAFRDAVVTIYANLVGDPEKKELGTFNVRQKGAPQEITIANFIAKTVAETDVTYKLTGVISALPTSKTGAYKLQDSEGNEVQITYLKKQDGSDYVYDNVDLKVGDVVTVYTVLTGTVTILNVKYGKGGSTTYPSYYQGRYRLTSTVTSNVTYEGGDVTIGVEIETDGDIVAPTTVSAEKNDANGALTSYNFDGSTANLTFGENTTSNSRSAGVTFTAGMAIVPISIMQDVAPEMKAGGWWLVLDADELQAGDQVIIAATGMDYAIINTTTTSASSFSSTAITKNGNKLETPSSSVQIFEIGKDGELYTFKGTLDKIAGRYLYASSKYSNAMKSYTTLDNNGKFTIDIDADGAATIVAQGANTYNQMQYNNGTTSAPAFYCTNGSKGAVCLYRYYPAAE